MHSSTQRLVAEPALASMCQIRWGWRETLRLDANVSLERHRLSADSVAAVEDEGLVLEVSDCSEFNAARAVDTEVQTTSFSSTDDFSLGHRELFWFQMPEFAKLAFDRFAKFVKVDCSCGQTNHSVRCLGCGGSGGNNNARQTR